ncbi:MAG TPA: hypothetical protein VF116_23395 [Ktedonobacterales bacterium]
MMDSNAIIGQVQSGAAPANWQVLRARRGFFVQGAIGGIVLAVFAAAAAVYLFATGTVVGYGLNDQTPNGVLTFWFIADMVVLAAIVVIGIVFCINRLVTLGSTESQLLVLMPQGFVMRLGSSAKATRRVSYQQIATMVPTVRRGNVSLVMQTRDGRKVTLPLDGRFGKPRPLAQQIQGMHAAYMAATVNARPGS